MRGRSYGMEEWIKWNSSDLAEIDTCIARGAYLMYFILSLYVCSEVLPSSRCSTLCSSLAEDILQSIDIWVLVMNDSLLTISFLLVPLNLGRSVNTVDVTVTWHECYSWPRLTQAEKRHHYRANLTPGGRPFMWKNSCWRELQRGWREKKKWLESVVQTKVQTNYITVDSRVSFALGKWNRCHWLLSTWVSIMGLLWWIPHHTWHTSF